MNKIENLEDHAMMATSVRANVPSDDRLVIVQSIENGKVKTIGARYRSGRWFGEETGDDLTSYILASPHAIWFESLLFSFPSSAPTKDKP